MYMYGSVYMLSEDWPRLLQSRSTAAAFYVRDVKAEVLQEVNKLNAAEFGKFQASPSKIKGKCIIKSIFLMDKFMKRNQSKLWCGFDTAPTRCSLRSHCLQTNAQKGVSISWLKHGGPATALGTQ